MAVGLGNWLTRRKHPTVWALKQCDESLVHLCGQATLQGRGSATDKLAQVRAGRFKGAVRMVENGAVLNAVQFAALIPQAELALVDDNQADWQGRRWQVAWVPQRCWLHDGRLVTQRTEHNGKTHLVSIEDVSDIRARAEMPRQHNPFISLEPLDQPQRDNDDSVSQRHYRYPQDKNERDV